MNNEHFQKLLNELIAGDIRQADHALLQQELKENKASREAFRERIDLESALRSWATEPVPHSPANLQSVQETTGNDARQSRRKQSAVIFSGIAFVVCMLIGLLIWNQLATPPNGEVVKEQNPQQPGAEPLAIIRTVGRIRQQPDCQWSVEPVTNSGRFPLGKLALLQGVAELRLDSGTDLVLEGPCELDVLAPDAARLLAGNVFVNVTELSSGFTLDTPESQILDEGTEYAVSLTRDATEVHVFDGSVIWIPSSQGKTPDFEDRIEAGEAKSYSRTEPTKIRRLPFGKRQFVRRLEQQIREQAGDGLIAFDGFENLAGRVRRDRSGFGWNGGWQTGSRGRGLLAEIVDINKEPDNIDSAWPRSGQRQILLKPGCDIRRDLEQPLSLQPGGTYYISFLLQRGPNQPVDEGQSLQVSLEPDLPGRGRRLHRTVSCGVTTDGFPFINSGNTIRETATRVIADQPVFCVLKLSVNEIGTHPALRVYRLQENIDNHEPDSWTVIGNPGHTVHSPNSLRITVGTQAVWLVDELRIATTWQAATTMTQLLQIRE